MSTNAGSTSDSVYATLPFHVPIISLGHWHSPKHPLFWASWEQGYDFQHLVHSCTSLTTVFSVPSLSALSLVGIFIESSQLVIRAW